MTILQRAVVSVILSLVFAITLALVFVGGLGLGADFQAFNLPGVLGVAVYAATLIGLGFSPAAFWALRTGAANLVRYGPVFWVVLALIAAVSAALLGVGGLFFLIPVAAAGLVTLGAIPPHDGPRPNQALAAATMGLLGVLFRRVLAEGQNRVNRPFKALNIWGEARPQLFFIFGVALIVLGLAAVFEPWLKP